jgi:enoyl-CoA hydratase/carnithine racemase
MNSAMVRELSESLDKVESEGARALLVRGEGRAFCSGRDLADADPLHEDGEAILRDVFNPLIERLAGLAVPTIAAVQGACLGTGLGLALACDIIYAADDARIGSPFARIGAVLDSGAHAAFVARVGAHRALELIYTGRLLSGREAAEWGLVNRSVAGADLVRRTREMAASIARGPTAAFVESKRIVRSITDASPSFAEVLAAEAAAQGRASRTHDYQDGISAFQEKRKPAFTGT